MRPNDPLNPDPMRPGTPPTFPRTDPPKKDPTPPTTTKPSVSSELKKLLQLEGLLGIALELDATAVAGVARSFARPSHFDFVALDNTCETERVSLI